MKVWCVRADGGRYIPQFLRFGFIGIGWLPQVNLLVVTDRQDLYSLYAEAYPGVSSRVVMGQQVGQIARFLLEIQSGDYVVSPRRGGQLYYGVVQGGYLYANGTDGCPYRHRKPVVWGHTVLKRQTCPLSLQKSLRSILSVFSVSPVEEFLMLIGER